MLEDKVLETIQKHALLEGENVVVGISGGPDSVCLLSILSSLSPKLDIKLHAVHINHMLRGREADEDQEYVTGLCEKFNIPLTVKNIDIRALAKNKGISLEEAGREARYEEFWNILKGLGNGVIAVAHNKNDQAETILMHIVRGTGLSGLKGMELKRGSIIRPLLDIRREEIEDYCSSHLLKPRTDSSNLESIYTRNKVRLELIPSISKLFDRDIIESLCRMALIVGEDSDFIEDNAFKVYNNCIQKRESNFLALDADKIRTSHPSIAKRVLRIAINELRGDLKGIETVHLEGIQSIIQTGVTGKQITIPGGICVRLSYGSLNLYKPETEEAVTDFEKPLVIPGRTEFLNNGYIIETDIIKEVKSFEDYTGVSQNSNVHYFDFDTIISGIYIRNRRNGDVFKPFGSNGSKKLKEYFIDKKIPRELRDNIPLIAKNNEIIWIVGHRTSDKFKVTENTKCVLKISFNKN